jgi:hypothetical protein
LICLALARPVLAQDAQALQTYRAQYDAMMSNFDRVLAAQGGTEGQERARRGREAMRAVTDQQLAALYSRTRLPDLSVAVVASQYLVRRPSSIQASPGAFRLVPVSQSDA